MPKSMNLKNFLHNHKSTSASLYTSMQKKGKKLMEAVQKDYYTYYCLLEDTSIEMPTWFASPLSCHT